MNRMTTALMIVVMTAMVACSSTPEPEPPAPQPESEFRTGDEPTEPPPPPPTSAPELGTIYFDYDSSSIRDDARSVLRANAESLRRGGEKVTIEGHTDERGSEEYNLALGERRASAVRRYLQNLGVPQGNMRTLSYGEAKPAARGNSESAWRWNRRADFRVQ